jgi:AcrR family transcriptional regulator
MSNVRRELPRATNRADEILNAAISIVIEEGYAALSIRSVAQRAGVGIGNLQHYFPTRTHLVRAALDRAFQQFERGAVPWRTEPELSPEEKMATAIDYVLADQKRADSCLLFWELWALAAHDEQAAAVMTDFYATYVNKVADIICEIRPRLPRLRAQKAGALVASLLEGASLFRGFGKARRGYLSGFDQNLRALVRTIIEQA